MAREADLTEQVVMNSSLQSENTALKESNSILEARRDELLTSLEKSKRRNDILESEKMDVFELASNMQADAQRLATQNQSLDEKAEVAKRTINRLSQQLAKLQQDNVQLASRIASIQNSAPSVTTVPASRTATVIVCRPGIDGWEPSSSN